MALPMNYGHFNLTYKLNLSSVSWPNVVAGTNASHILWGLGLNTWQDVGDHIFCYVSYDGNTLANPNGEFLDSGCSEFYMQGDGSLLNGANWCSLDTNTSLINVTISAPTAD